MDRYAWCSLWFCATFTLILMLAAFSPNGDEKKFNTCIAGKVDPAVCAELLKPACGGAKP